MTYELFQLTYEMMSPFSIAVRNCKQSKNEPLPTRLNELHGKNSIFESNGYTYEIIPLPHRDVTHQSSYNSCSENAEFFGWNNRTT